jgi:thiol-disulfide isomerase/thioredoxin
LGLNSLPTPKKSNLPGLILIGFSLLFIACGEKQGISGRIPTVSFKTYTGESFVLAAEDKQVTLLVFWATWCQPCLMEIPSLIQLQEKFKGQEFRVVSVNVDDPEGQKVKAIRRENGINYPTLIGTEDIMKQFGGVKALPTSFLIGKNGRILEKLQGYDPEAGLEHKISTALEATE